MTTTRFTAPVEGVVPEWELSDRLARSLRLVEMTGPEVAEFLGVRRETISRWMNGKNRPPKAALMVWADMTGVDQTWLETGTAPGRTTEGLTLYTTTDLNREPADLQHGAVNVRPGLTVVRSARYLRAVAS